MPPKKLKSKISAVVSRVIRRRPPDNRIDGHRCTRKGCGRFFRTKHEVFKHEIRDAHCGKCGFGTYDPFGIADRYKLCDACMFELEPPPKKKMSRN